MKLPGKGMSWKDFGKKLKNEYKRDNINDSAAALTYFFVLALFPFLLFLVALTGVVMRPEQVTGLVTELATVAPEDAVGLIEGQLQSVVQSSSGGLLTFGIVAALWAASGGINALIRALNTVYDVEETRPFWKVRPLAIGMTIVTAVIAVAAALIAVAAPAAAAAVGGPLGTAITWLRLPVAGLLMMFVWALLYWALPDVEQKFKFLSPGAIVGVVIWVSASWAFSLYVKNFGSYDATYGALGGVIVMLLWMWISSQVLLLGAEINAILEHESEEGKRAGAKKQSDTGASRKGEEGRMPRQPPPARPPSEEPRHLH